jgi:tetratricopeptide (TPR) repeat protein
MKQQSEILEGRIDQVPVPEIVREIHSGGLTGVLLLAQQKEEKKICFLDGKVVYASSTLKAEKLGYLLVEEGLVSKEAIVDAAQSGEELRGYLLERGALGGEQLDEATARLITDIVATAFDWQGGDFSFVARDEMDVPGMVEGVAMGDLFVEGARCIEDRERVRKLLGDASKKIGPAGAGSAEERGLHLEPMEELVLAGVDGSQSVAEVVAASPMGDEMTERFLYGLLLCGHLASEGYKRVPLPRSVKRSKVLSARNKGKRVKPRKSVLKAKKATAAKKPAAKAAAPAQAQAPEPEEPKELTMEEEVEKLFGELEEGNHYEILGLERKAGDEAIRRQYHDLARRIHPDRLAKDADPVLREKVEKVFARLGEAYNVLREKESREEYDERLAAGTAEEKKAVDPRELAAESFTKGMFLYKRGDMATAGQYFQHAANLAPDREEYWRHVGLALSRHSLTRKKAEDAFLKAIELSPAAYTNYYHLGMLYKAGGLKTRAIQMFEKYMMWDAEDDKVLKELAELRGEDDDKKGGALGGLLGKKK